MGKFVIKVNTTYSVLYTATCSDKEINEQGYSTVSNLFNANFEDLKGIDVSQLLSYLPNNWKDIMRTNSAKHYSYSRHNNSKTSIDESNRKYSVKLLTSTCELIENHDMGDTQYVPVDIY
jgi:hypothetical protein